MRERAAGPRRDHRLDRLAEVGRRRRADAADRAQIKIFWQKTKVLRVCELLGRQLRDDIAELRRRFGAYRRERQWRVMRAGHDVLVQPLIAKCHQASGASTYHKTLATAARKISVAIVHFAHREEEHNRDDENGERNEDDNCECDIN